MAMKTELELLLAVAEAAREIVDNGGITSASLIKAVMDLDAQPAPVGETVEVWGCVYTDTKGYVSGRVGQNEETARRLAAEWGATENGPIMGSVFRARVPLPVIPTIAAEVEI